MPGWRHFFFETDLLFFVSFPKDTLTFFQTTLLCFFVLGFGSIGIDNNDNTDPSHEPDDGSKDTEVDDSVPVPCACPVLLPLVEDIIGSMSDIECYPTEDSKDETCNPDGTEDGVPDDFAFVPFLSLWSLCFFFFFYDVILL